MSGLKSEFYKVSADTASSITPQPSRVKSLRSNHLRVEMFDVGMGEAVLLTSSTGESILVDGGSGRRTINVANALSRVILKGSLVAFIATHPHFDHLGGIAHLVREHSEVLAEDVTFYESGVPALSKGKEQTWWGDLLDALQQAGVKRKSVTRVIRPKLLGEKVKVALYAKGAYKPADYQSVFMHVTFGLSKLIFTGDAHCDYENQLLKAYKSKKIFTSHVIKVTHHGGQNGTSRRFVSAIKPGIAIASTYDESGHMWEKVSKGRIPPTCLKRETWLDGDIVLITDGKSIGGGVLFEVETQHPGRLSKALNLPMARPQYDGHQVTSKKQKVPCDGM